MHRCTLFHVVKYVDETAQSPTTTVCVCIFFVDSCVHRCHIDDNNTCASTAGRAREWGKRSPNPMPRPKERLTYSPACSNTICTRRPEDSTLAEHLVRLCNIVYIHIPTNIYTAR